MNSLIRGYEAFWCRLCFRLGSTSSHETYFTVSQPPASQPGTIRNDPSEREGRFCTGRPNTILRLTDASTSGDSSKTAAATGVNDGNYPGIEVRSPTAAMLPIGRAATINRLFAFAEEEEQQAGSDYREPGEDVGHDERREEGTVVVSAQKPPAHERQPTVQPAARTSRSRTPERALLSGASPTMSPEVDGNRVEDRPVSQWRSTSVETG